MVSACKGFVSALRSRDAYTSSALKLRSLLRHCPTTPQGSGSPGAQCADIQQVSPTFVAYRNLPSGSTLGSGTACTGCDIGAACSTQAQAGLAKGTLA